MPENKTETKPSPEVPKTETKPDPTAALKAENDALRARITELEKAAKYALDRNNALEKKLKAAKSAPTGDVVFLGGKTWAIKGTVEAKFALDQVKKGYIFEDATLVILDSKPLKDA